MLVTTLVEVDNFFFKADHADMMIMKLKLITAKHGTISFHEIILSSSQSPVELEDVIVEIMFRK